MASCPRVGSEHVQKEKKRCVGVVSVCLAFLPSVHLHTPFYPASHNALLFYALLSLLVASLKGEEASP